MRPFALAILMLVAAVLVSPSPAAGDDNDLLDQIELTHKATRERLRSYTASGTYTRKEKDWKEAEATKFKLQYKSGNYRLEIFPPRVDRPEPQYDKIIVVADADCFYSTLYSKRFPAGCETSIRKRDSASVQAATGMSMDVANLDLAAAQIPKIRKQYGMRAAQDANGDIHTEHDLDEVTRVECTAAAAAGLNISRIAFVHPSTGNPQAITTFAWEQKKDAWYVKEVEQAYSKSGTIYKVRFDTFDIDVPLDDKLFTFEGLDPCPGSRVIDRRPKAERK
jgi:hypothetical protein